MYGLAARESRHLAVNELPDRRQQIQWTFEHHAGGDIQIKGYSGKAAADVMLVFTAKPEDAAGKDRNGAQDRIGSEIRTTYPLT